MKHTLLFALTASMLMASPAKGLAQELLYPHHFNLSEVTLLDSPMKRAMDLNIQVLLDYDADRLLTPSSDKPASPPDAIPIGCNSIPTSRIGAATALTSQDT